MYISLISPLFNAQYGRTREKALVFPPLNLPIVASLTPPDVEVRIFDENVEDLDYDRAAADLVGITAMTAQAPRAYEIADELRRRGSKVVLGGIHPSVLPEEAGMHADAVAIGEAESVWPEILSDFGNGGLKPCYRTETRPSLVGLPPPRRDLLKLGEYIIDNTIQIARGCSHRCTFCSVSKIFGEQCRYRPVEDVLQEVASLRKSRLRSRFFGLLDDNVVNHPQRAADLFRGLKSLKIIWAGQAPLSLADRPDMLRMMSESGCKALFIGLESASPDALSECNKSWLHPRDFREKVDRFHDNGIAVHGAFIFGFDTDDESVFKRTVEFADAIGIDSAQFSILTPFPGTELRRRLEAEGRILSSDWSLYGLDEAVFRPLKMSPECLQEGYHYAWREFYNLRRIGARTLSAFRRSPILPLLIFQLQYRKLMRHREKIRKVRIRQAVGLKKFPFSSVISGARLAARQPDADRECATSRSDR